MIVQDEHKVPVRLCRRCAVLTHRTLHLGHMTSDVPAPSNSELSVQHCTLIRGDYHRDPCPSFDRCERELSLTLWKIFLFVVCVSGSLRHYAVTSVTLRLIYDGVIVG